MAHEDVREEKHMREKLQRERDQLLSEKYSLEQTVQNLRMDEQSAIEKIERLDKELNDILVSGKDNSEVSLFCYMETFCHWLCNSKTLLSKFPLEMIFGLRQSDQASPALFFLYLFVLWRLFFVEEKSFQLH